MELNATYNAFFTLLRAGLWSREPDCSCFPLAPKLWERVYILARKQTVEGVVYDGMMRLPDNYLPPRELLLKWVVAVDSIEQKNRRMNKVAAELSGLFAKNHITAFMRKGQGVAACYDNPLHRVCGDIDWFFPDEENFDRAFQLMNGRVKIEKHERLGVCYTWRGIFIEHHRHLLDIYNPFLSGCLRRTQQQEYARSEYLDIHEQKIALPSPILAYLSVNAHILKHLLAFGVTLRQLCDSARLCCAYHNGVEAGELKEIYRKLGIYRWVQLLNRLLTDDLGMPEEYLPFPPAPQQKAGWMMRDILRGGFFGMYGTPFTKESDEPREGGKYKLLHLMVIFCRYVRYAPGEAFWFPLMHAYSDVRNWLSR